MTAPQRSPRYPLNLRTMGHLFVGGRINRSFKGSPMVGQMYAEFFIPHRLKSPYPIVMIHGGFQTGTNFTGTPDGREGWAQFFLRRGHTVYVVDQVARGRAAHSLRSQGAVSAPDLDFTRVRFVTPRRYVSCKFVRLADLGIRGNGHMMMLEKNSDEIAAVIEDWLKATLGGRHPRRTRRRIPKRAHKTSRNSSTFRARLSRSK